MTNIDFFKQTCYRISELITKNYSTSFSLAVSLLEKEERKAIYAIYGFVRLADEIVDSFDGFDKEFLLEKLKSDLDYALLNGISTNPVILAFVDTVKKYRIEKKFIDAFIRSMEYDLYKTNYKTQHELEQYIYGSAEVVGLMCLKVFCKEDENLFSELVPYAKSLGSAFQKVNFLRDINADMNKLG
ncbi:MAG: squalene/phytoene synthase family protein, partial [Dysgonamonadaceae bacterium]